MWLIVEADSIGKKCSRLPEQVVKKYELWKSVVRYNGPNALKKFPGFRDEGLKGEWRGYRSSRLNIQYRVLYRVDRGSEIVRVENIHPHTY